MQKIFAALMIACDISPNDNDDIIEVSDKMCEMLAASQSHEEFNSRIWAWFSPDLNKESEGDLASMLKFSQLLRNATWSCHFRKERSDRIAKAMKLFE